MLNQTQFKPKYLSCIVYQVFTLSLSELFVTVYFNDFELDSGVITTKCCSTLSLILFLFHLLILTSYTWCYQTFAYTKTENGFAFHYISLYINPQ